ncbi:MAG TPA: DUF485 domain-containing protein [Alcanivoracaceae bacterium]|nr:DUF485 domain-containing protein [Alcanivoracaceae bacterium]
MMGKQSLDYITNHPKFKELVAKRTRLAITLTVIVAGLFYALILMVAFTPEMIGKPIGFGGLTLGVALVLSFFILFWLLTAFYVFRANNTFDSITEALIHDINKNNKE